MSMSSEHPLLHARWIGADPACQSPVLIRRFCAEDVRQALLYVTGLGYFEAKLNGRTLTEDRFLPVVSDYEPRDLRRFLYPLRDRTTNRIYYCRFDVTGLLRPSENTLTIQLGNGWYRQTERTAEGDTAYGPVLKAIYSLKLENADGCFAIDSDGSETWHGSQIVYNQLFIGEIHDAAAPAGPEQPVTVLPAPDALLELQRGTPDRCVRQIIPRCIGQSSRGLLYDAGENISGLVRVHTRAPAGSRIVLRYAENLTDRGEPDFSSTGGSYICASGRPQIMEDVFLCDGTARTFEPKFVWHAFRYMEITGDFDRLEVLVIHSGCPVTARFDSPSEGLNYLYDAFLRTQLNNMHGSIPSDCPHRERLGYTGDGQVCAEAAMTLLDAREFYRKWIRDILDCQDPDTGHVQHTAPLMGGGGGPGGWGCAIVLVPWTFYRQYGDLSVLEQCYEPMRRWVGYLETHCRDGLLVREEPGGWCLGDWCPLEEPMQIPPAYVNSCYFVKILGILERIAPLLGRAEQAEAFRTLRLTVSDAIRRTYQDPATGSFVGGVQGADAFAVWSGLAGAETAEKLARTYDRLGRFDAGFLGTDILMEVLCDSGHIDTALKLLESEAPGSFLYQKRRGATTLWENWTGGGSENHPMFGACLRQLFSAILGIRQSPDSAGFQSLRISPQIPRSLPWASGTRAIPAGAVSVAWRKAQSHIRFQIDLPPGTTAWFSYGSTRQLLCQPHTELCLSLT